MKKINLLIICFFLFLLCGCHSVTDDFISKYCPGSCTVIKGRLSTDDGKTPLPGITLEVKWLDYGTLGMSSLQRRKAITTTDANGNYELKFLLRDEELDRGNNSGFFTVEAPLEQDKYINCKYTDHLLTYYELQRDTTILMDYNLPQKAFINVQLSNKEAIKLTDQFMTTFIFKGGENNSMSCGKGLSFSRGSDSETSVPVAANQQVIIRTYKRKDDIETITEHPVTLTPGQTMIYKAEF